METQSHRIKRYADRTAGFVKNLFRGVRILFLIPVLSIMAVAGDQALDWRARQDADTLIKDINRFSSPDLRYDLYGQLWTIVSSSERQKKAFVERFLDDRRLQFSLFDNQYYLFQSIIGLDPDGERRSWILERALVSEVSSIVPALLAANIWHSAPNRFEDSEQAIISALLVAMETTGESRYLYSLVVALMHFDEKLTDQQVERATRYLARITEDETYRRPLKNLAITMNHFGDRLPEEHLKTGVQQVINMMTATEDPTELVQFANVLRSFDSIPPELAKAAAKRLIEAINNAEFMFHVRELAVGLSALGKSLPAEAAKMATDKMLEALDKTTPAFWFLAKEIGETENSRRLTFMGEGLEGLDDKRTLEQAIEGSSRLVDAMAETENPLWLLAIGSGLDALGDKLPVQDAAAAIEILQTAMSSVDDSNPHISATDLLIVLRVMEYKLGTRLDEKRNQELAGRLLDTMKRTSDPNTLGALALALAQFDGPSTIEHVEAGIAHLLKVMGPTNPNKLNAFGLGLARLGAHDSSSKAPEIAHHLTRSMAITLRPSELLSHTGKLTTLGEKLPRKDAFKATQRLIKAMDATMSDNMASAELAGLAQGIGALGPRLAAEHVNSTSRYLADSAKQMPHAHGFAGFVTALRAFKPSEDPAAIDTAVDLLQNPLAVAKWRRLLLDYYGNLTGQSFGTTDELIAWANQNRSDLDFSRQAENPFERIKNP